MVAVAARQHQQGHPSSRLLLTVHDELVLEVEESEFEQAVAGVRVAMEGAATLRVPLVVDMAAGPSWGELTCL